MVNSVSSSTVPFNVAQAKYTSQKNTGELLKTDSSKELVDTAEISQAAIDAYKAEKC